VFFVDQLDTRGGQLELREDFLCALTRDSRRVLRTQVGGCYLHRLQYIIFVGLAGYDQLPCEVDKYLRQAMDDATGEGGQVVRLSQGGFEFCFVHLAVLDFTSAVLMSGQTVARWRVGGMCKMDWSGEHG